MTPKVCKYGCGTMLEGFDEENRKFLEAGTGGLHTKERCQEAKSKKEQKDDHGNESYDPIKETQRFSNVLPTEAEKYVDHTAKGTRPSKVKIFKSDNPDLLEIQYNEFNKEHSSGWVWARAQLAMNDGKIAIALYYEETKQ
jgi:hypothetical protein